MSELTMDKWGPNVWYTLHMFAHTAPERLSAVEQREYAQWLHLTAKRLPCPTCRTHFADFLRRKMTPTSVSTRADLVALMNDAHNEVNARKGKRIYTFKEHYDVYSGRRRRRREMLRSVLTVVALGGVVSVLHCRQRRKIFSTH